MERLEYKKEEEEKKISEIKKRISENLEKGHEETERKARQKMAGEKDSTVLLDAKIDINRIKDQLRIENERIKAGSSSEDEIRKIKSNAEKEAEREMYNEFRRTKKISSTKAYIASRIASSVLTESAYRIAKEMEERANRGGHWAIIIFYFTLCIAVVIDILDVIGELGIELAAIPTIIVWLVNFFLSLIIIFFWMFVLGGGHKKWFWKRVIRMLFVLLVAESVPILDLFPFTVFIVCWNWYDFSKERKEAKEDLENFKVEFEKTRKINEKYLSNPGNY